MKFLSLLLLLAAGCVSQNHIDVTVLSEDLRDAVPGWKREAARRFKDCRLVFCHGADSFGAFLLSPTKPQSWVSADSAMFLVSEIEEGRTIVLIACNPYGHTLHGPPNIYYAKELVWQVPDRDVSWQTNFWREFKVGNGTGDIYEFVRAEPLKQT